MGWWRHTHTFDLKWHKQQAAIVNCAGSSSSNPIAECLCIDNELIIGQDKHAGGAASPYDNYACGAPRFTKQVLWTHAPTNAVECIGLKHNGEVKL